VQNPPAHRAQQPLAQEQGPADRQQQGREQDDRDGQGAEGKDPSDLAGDLAELGLGQVDVGTGQRDRGRPGGADLRAQARGRLARPVVTRTRLRWDRG
jgi:hypothetical protein